MPSGLSVAFSRPALGWYTCCQITAMMTTESTCGKKYTRR
jgi:hypothetical protein